MQQVQSAVLCSSNSRTQRTLYLHVTVVYNLIYMPSIYMHVLLVLSRGHGMMADVIINRKVIQSVAGQQPAV